MFRKILLGSVMTMAAVTGANAVIIDDFTDAPQSISISGPRDGAPCVVNSPLGNTCSSGNDSSIPGLVVSPLSRTVLDNESEPGAADGVFAASILGGYRDFTTTLVQSPGRSRKTNSDAAAVTGEFSHSQDSGVYSNTFITWNGLAGAGLNADFSQDTGIRLVVLSADAGVQWSLQLFDSDSNWTDSFSTAAIGSPTGLYRPFSNFSGINFSDIQKIVFGANIDSHVDFDTSVGLLETVGNVPEPASLTLLGAGIMGLGAVKRRRKV